MYMYDFLSIIPFFYYHFISENEPIPLCANGGKCTDDHDGFHCQCSQGFTGKYCENGKIKDL